MHDSLDHERAAKRCIGRHIPFKRMLCIQKEAIKHCLKVRITSRDMGWEKDDVWFAHCCMLDETETAQFAQHGIGLAHCPSSNMRLASGEPPLRFLDVFRYACTNFHVWPKSLAKQIYSAVQGFLACCEMRCIHSRPLPLAD